MFRNFCLLPFFRNLDFILHPKYTFPWMLELDIAALGRYLLVLQKDVTNIHRKVDKSVIEYSKKFLRQA